jgi:two-component system, NtrC family, sensor kinase
MKINIKVFYLILFFGFYKAFGEVGNLEDSLKIVLSKKMEDTSKVILLEQISKNLWNSDLENALKYANQGLELAEKINFEKGKSRCLNRIGAIQSRMGNHQKGLVILFEALALAKEINDEEGLARANINLGIIYGEQLDHRKAIEYYQEALRISKKINNQNLYNLALMNIGAEYVPLKLFDSAQVYLKKSYDLGVKNKSQEIDILLYNLGNIYSKKNNHTEALKYFWKSKQFSEKSNNQRFLSLSNFMLAKSYQSLGKIDSALYFAERSNSIAKQTSNLELISDSYGLLSELVENTNLKLSLEYFKKAAIAKGQLYNFDKNLQIQKLTYRESILNKDLEFAKKEFRNKQIIGLTGSVLGIFLIISVALFFVNKNKTKAHKKLTAQKKEIENQKVELNASLEKLKLTQKQLVLQEKLASLGELTAGIAHEIQNPLNFVNNFSELSIELLEELEVFIKQSHLKEQGNVNELLNELITNQQKINSHGNRASSIVKNMLEHSRASKSETSEVDINKIADEYLHLSYHGMRAKDHTFNADFEVNFEDNLPLIKGMSGDIGRVFLNIINNAFYAVNTKRKESKEPDYKPKVRVISKWRPNEKNGIVEVRIEDNGNGIPNEIKEKVFQPFFTTKPSGYGTGLGLSLSREIIVNGHNGSIDIETEPEKGTIFIIQFPV